MKKENKEALMPYADTLLSERIRAGLTQEELAEKSGLVSNTIYRYEAGERGMSFVNAVKLAEAMNISVVDLLPTGAGGILQARLYRTANRNAPNDGTPKN